MTKNSSTFTLPVIYDENGEPDHFEEFWSTDIEPQIIKNPNYKYHKRPVVENIYGIEFVYPSRQEMEYDIHGNPEYISVPTEMGEHYTQNPKFKGTRNLVVPGNGYRDVKFLNVVEKKKPNFLKRFLLFVSRDVLCFFRRHD